MFLRKIKSAIYEFIYKMVEQSKEYKINKMKNAMGIPASVRVSDSLLSGNIEIGEQTYISPGSVIASGITSKVTIGKYCAIGRYVSIVSRGHSLKFPTADETHESHEHVEQDTCIGDYVWIGDHVFIKHGVIVGDYAIIGANSIVTKDVKRFEVVGGVPARHIRFNTEHYKYKEVNL